MEMQSHQGVLTFLRDFTHQPVSVVEILWTPTSAADASPASLLLPKTPFAELRVFKIALLRFRNVVKPSTATLRWEEFPKWAVPGDIDLRPRQL